MPVIKSHILFIFFCLGLFSTSKAQIDLERKRFEDYPIRYILNKFSIDLSTGYGRTFYRSELDDFYYIRNAQGSVIIDKNANIEGSGPLDGYSNWFTTATPITLAAPLLPANNDILSPDSSQVAMRGGGNSIPFSLAVYYNLRRFRLGGGVTANFHTLHEPAPKKFFSLYPEPDRKTRSLVTQYYGLVGYSIYEYLNYAFAADLRFGKN